MIRFTSLLPTSLQINPSRSKSCAGCLHRFHEAQRMQARRGAAMKKMIDGVFFMNKTATLVSRTLVAGMLISTAFGQAPQTPPQTTPQTPESRPQENAPAQVPGARGGARPTPPPPPPAVMPPPV